MKIIGKWFFYVLGFYYVYSLTQSWQHEAFEKWIDYHETYCRDLWTSMLLPTAYFAGLAFYYAGKKEAFRNRFLGFFWQVFLIGGWLEPLFFRGCPTRYGGGVAVFLLEYAPLKIWSIFGLWQLYRNVPMTWKWLCIHTILFIGCVWWGAEILRVDFIRFWIASLYAK